MVLNQNLHIIYIVGHVGRSYKCKNDWSPCRLVSIKDNYYSAEVGGKVTL